MKSIYSFILIVLIFAIGCATNKDCKKYFSNKVIVYSVQEMGEDSAWNSFFIAFENDSIIQVEFPFGFFQKEINNYKEVQLGDGTKIIPITRNIFPSSRLPFLFLKEGKQIFISYVYRNQKIKKPYYSLNIHDSIAITDFRYLCSPMSFNSGISRYTGKDTVIAFNQSQFKCWIFEECYRNNDFRSQSIKRKILIEKCSLLPILRIDQYYKDPGLTVPIGLPNISKLNFIIDNNNSFYNKYHCQD